MKILLLVNEVNEKVPADFFSGLHREIGSVDLRRLSVVEQVKLKQYFMKNIDISRYDRIVFSIEFDNIRKNLKFLQSLSRLVFLDFDNHSHKANGDGKDKYFDFYRKIPWARIIVTSNKVATKYNKAGLNSIFIARGFSLTDPAYVRPEVVEMKELYKKRSSFLSLIAQKNMQLTIANEYASGKFLDLIARGVKQPMWEESREVRLSIFPDIGFGEYSDEVFKAMSQGDVVLAFDQGAVENSALGFDDMKNIILFSSFEEFEQKMEKVIRHPKQALAVAKEGEFFVKSKYQYYDLGVAAAKAIAKKTRKSEDYKVGLTFFGFRI